MKLILGTAQLGNVYGYANKSPATTYSQCRDIVHTAYLNGIRFFDTAPAYGPAVKYLGQALKEIEATEAKIITKIDPNYRPDDEEDPVLCTQEPYAILSHGYVPKKPRDHQPHLIKFGASLDLPIQAWTAIECDWIDVLQVPYNMQQTDMLRPIQAAQEKGIEVMVRSIMMQGKLFDFGCTVKECMDFVHTTLPDCMQVIGAETADQVNELCEIARQWDE